MRGAPRPAAEEFRHNASVAPGSEMPSKHCWTVRNSRSCRARSDDGAGPDGAFGGVISVSSRTCRICCRIPARACATPSGVGWGRCTRSALALDARVRRQHQSAAGQFDSGEQRGAVGEDDRPRLREGPFGADRLEFERLGRDDEAAQHRGILAVIRAVVEQIIVDG